MMAPLFKKIKKTKKTHLFIFITSIVIFIGLLAFVIAESVAHGIMSVLSWFGSSDAILLYIGLGVYGLLVAWLIFQERINKI